MSSIRDTPAPPLETWPPQACRNADPRLFFPAPDGGGKRAWFEREAKAVCGQCEAREVCLAYALPIQDLAGIWAGTNEHERSRARKKQKEA